MPPLASMRCHCIYITIAPIILLYKKLLRMESGKPLLNF
jgi:hypothetical protein